MKFLAHIEDHQQKTEFWTKIKNAFKEKDSKFQIFLKYFESNWLSHYIVTNTEDIQERNIRTNNVCEVFNKNFKNFIGMVHPNLNIFISKLLDYENILKLNLISDIEAGKTRAKLISKIIYRSINWKDS